MKNKNGFLVYKCRKCGELDKSTHVSNGMLMLANHVVGVETDIAATGIHNCKNGDLGITDLIGFEFDKEVQR